MGLLDYFSKPRGPEASGLFGHLLDTDRPAGGRADPQKGPSFQVAQYLAPFLTLFARPPVIIPRQLTPLEQLPKGSAGGDTAGRLFPRSFYREQPEGVPCTYCGRSTTKENPGPNKLHLDHIIPKGRGGNASAKNRAPSCQSCNLEKGSRTPEEWYLWIQNGGA